MLTARVCTIERPGGPEVIEWREIELNGEPANDELLTRHRERTLTELAGIGPATRSRALA